MLRRLKKYVLRREKNPWLFFGVTFILTWSFWIPAALLNKKIDSLPVIILIILGGIAGKLIPPSVLPYLAYGKKGWRDYWQRLIDFKRISLKWWLITLFLPVLFTSLGVFTAYLIGYDLPDFEMANILKIIPYAIFLLIYGPLPEEMGWCGYELDRLQARYNALKSSLILGGFWLLWHLPLFFIEGSYQHTEVVFSSLRFWFAFVPGIISLQILQTWIYNNTNRSTLTAVMIHFMVNFNGEMLALNDVQEYLRSFWSVLFTVIVVIIWGYKTLTGNNKVPEFEKIIKME